MVEGCLLVAALLCFAQIEGQNVDTPTTCNAIKFCKTCPFENGKAVCTECAKLYALDTSANACKACREIDGCWVCNNMTLCDRCRYPRKDGPDLNGVATCSACAENCKFCGKSGSGKCDRCLEGFSKDSNGKCSQCPENSQECKRDVLIPSRFAWVRCNNGFYQSSADTCSPCGVENCQFCTDASSCILCQAGFFSQGPDKCKECSSNCAVCDKKGNGKCNKCKNGKVSANGACDCGENCETCGDSGFGKCDKCKDGFKITEDKICIGFESQQ